MTKLNRKVKISLWLVGGLVVLLALAALVISVLADRATDTFRSQASQQLNAAVAGESTGVTVELRTVWLGDLLNKDYKKISGLQSDYERLLGDVKNYAKVLSIHNTLVDQYNKGIKGEKPLNGDLLSSISQYLAAMRSRFPDEKDRIQMLEDLSQKITASTDFDAVSADIDTLLQSNDGWLSDIQKRLNERITKFQEKVN